MTINLATRSICLVPTMWQQDMMSSYPQHHATETRALWFHAKASLPENLFGRFMVNSILFEIRVLSDTVAATWREARPSGKENFGRLKYHEGTEDCDTGEKEDPVIAGDFSVSDAMFEDLWERVKLKVALPCSVSLSVLGLEIDLSPANEDFWDFRRQPTLEVLGANLSFFTHQSCVPSPVDDDETNEPEAD